MLTTGKRAAEPGFCARASCTCTPARSARRRKISQVLAKARGRRRLPLARSARSVICAAIKHSRSRRDRERESAAMRAEDKPRRGFTHRQRRRRTAQREIKSRRRSRRRRNSLPRRMTPIRFRLMTIHETACSCRVFSDYL